MIKNELYMREMMLALEEIPEHTLWAIGHMEEGPFARLILPNPNGTYQGGYVESPPGEARTVPQAIRFALNKKEGVRD
jgi:hypothetical protein